MGYWDDGHMDNGWGIAMMLGMLGFWLLLTAAIVVAIVWSVRSTRTFQVAAPVPPASAAGSGVTASAEQILAERLARGEIDPEEYQTRMDALRARSAP